MRRIKNFIFGENNARMKLIFGNQLLTGSFVMIVSSTLVNFGNYLYHLFMVRMLGPVNYGALNSLIAIFYLLAIPSLALITVVVKFTTVYKAQNDYSKLYSLFRSFSEKVLILGAMVILFSFLVRESVAEFLHLSEAGFIPLVGSFLLLSLLTTVNNGILQGLLNFNFLAANNIFSTILKVGLAFLFVGIGLSVDGALLAILVSYIVPYFISLYPLRFLVYHRPKQIKIERRKILNYAIPATIATFGLTSLYSTDIILVKHFFPAFEAGLYSALAVVGKIIFFASSTISIVMFPIISEKFEEKKEYRSVFHQALLLVLASSFFLTIVYFFQPVLIIKLLSGNAYLEGVKYLGFFAIFISIFCLINLMVQFFLSVRETKIAFLPLGAALLQGILIWLFHENFYQVIGASIFATSLLLSSLLIYYVMNLRRNLHLGK